MTGYTKLFSSIIHSTVWRAPNHVRLVWVTMMAMADKNGEVEASMPGLADAARVSLDECSAALGILAAPDIHSRSREHEGRRIRAIDGGWELLNHRKYRDKMSEADLREKNRVRMAKWRSEQSDGNAPCDDPCENVTDGNASHDIQTQKADADSKAETESTPTKRKPKKRAGPMPDGWEPNTAAADRATTVGLRLDAEAADFREWTASKGSAYVDWDAAFMSHLRRRAAFRDDRGLKGSPQAAQEDAALSRRRENQRAQERAQRKREAEEQESAATPQQAMAAIADVVNKIGGK